MSLYFLRITFLLETDFCSSDGDWSDWRPARYDSAYLFDEEPKCPWAGKREDKSALEVLHP